MDIAKAHVLITIVATQLAALVIDGQVPYFPIEVSRTAAAGPVALWTLRIGFTLLLLVLDYCGGTAILTTRVVALWISLVCIAWFDDENNWLMHMLGVGGMVATILAGMTWDRLLPVAMGIALYLLRIVIKVIVVLCYEVNREPGDGLVALLRKSFNVAMDIMFRGPGACSHPEAVMPIFKICGVLQWAAFYCLSFAL